MPDTTKRAQEIRAELDKLAPEPVAEPGATARLARYTATEAQLALARLWTRGAESGPKDALLLGAYYAAARALAGFEAIAPGAGDALALAIVEDWEDGLGAAEWIAAYLGADAEAIAKLAQELATVKPAAQPGVVVDPEDLRAALSSGRILPDDVYDRLRTAAGMAS